jgi:hypothetical protein
VEIKDLIIQTNLFFGTLSCSPWVMLATWLRLEAPQKNTRKLSLQPILTIKLFLTHIHLELHMLGYCQKAHEICSSNMVEEF